MNVLISGARGYIGRRLVEHFEKNGASVSLLIKNTENLSNFFKKNVKYIYDITSDEQIVFSKKYDYFVHLAAANDIDSKNTKKALEITTLGTKNCLKLALDNGIKNFIYFSTFQVYGVAEGFVSEETPLRPLNDYAITHYFAEEYVKMFNRLHGMNYVIIRPANIYGAPESLKQDRWSLVPSCFCKEAYETGAITLLSSGKQLKDFIGLDQLTDWTYQIISKFETFQNQEVNFSSEKSETIISMAEKVAEVYRRKFNKNCEIQIRSDQPAFVNSLMISNEKLKKGISLNVASNLEEEIENIFKILVEGETHGSN